MLSQLSKIIKIGLVASVFFIPATSFAQKFYKPTIDKFSGDTTSSTSQERIASNDSFSSTTASYLNASIKKINGKYFFIITIDVTTSDNQYFLVSQGDIAFIKLADNSLVKLSSVAPSQAKRQTIKKGFVEREYFVADIGYALPNDSLQKMLASDVSAIRIAVDGANFDFDLKAKDSQMVKNMLGLISGGK